jgi:LuxR family transcriptional regulator, maltose regulon positive regulatory protein
VSLATLAPRTAGDGSPDPGTSADTDWTVILRRQPPRISGEILLRLAPMLADLGDRAGAVMLLDQARRLHTALPDRTTAQLDRLRRLERQLADPLRGLLLAEPLTERERGVPQLLHSTLTLYEIGEELFVTLNTIKTHTGAIYRKLGVAARRDAVAKALDLGLIPSRW